MFLFDVWPVWPLNLLHLQMEGGDRGMDQGTRGFHDPGETQSRW